jgi:hypothetical protein
VFCELFSKDEEKKNRVPEINFRISCSSHLFSALIKSCKTASQHLKIVLYRWKKRSDGSGDISASAASMDGDNDNDNICELLEFFLCSQELHSSIPAEKKNSCASGLDKCNHSAPFCLYKHANFDKLSPAIGDNNNKSLSLSPALSPNCTYSDMSISWEQFAHIQRVYDARNTQFMPFFPIGDNCMTELPNQMLQACSSSLVHSRQQQQHQNQTFSSSRVSSSSFDTAALSGVGSETTDFDQDEQDDESLSSSASSSSSSVAAKIKSARKKKSGAAGTTSKKRKLNDPAIPVREREISLS